MEVQDVPAICAAARERGIVTLIDNTWATPLLFPAHAAGVDISILALSKYVGGHSDVMMGSASATAEHFPRLQKTALGHRPRGIARRRLACLARAEDAGGAAQAA